MAVVERAIAAAVEPVEAEIVSATGRCPIRPAPAIEARLAGAAPAEDPRGPAASAARPACPPRGEAEAEVGAEAAVEDGGARRAVI